MYREAGKNRQRETTQGDKAMTNKIRARGARESAKLRKGEKLQCMLIWTRSLNMITCRTLSYPSISLLIWWSRFNPSDVDTQEIQEHKPRKNANMRESNWSPWTSSRAWAQNWWGCFMVLNLPPIKTLSAKFMPDARYAHTPLPLFVPSSRLT